MRLCCADTSKRMGTSDNVGDCLDGNTRLHLWHVCAVPDIQPHQRIQEAAQGWQQGDQSWRLRGRALK